jgi:predicted SprT family Zn-dependent metalloprotease
MKKNSTVRNKKSEPSTTGSQITGDFSKPTLLQFTALQQAYDFYNQELFFPIFTEILSPVMLSLNDNHRRRYVGYYAFDKYKDEQGNILSLINLTPEYLNQPFMEVMSTLVHEMCHHYQYTLGVKKGRRTPYHDKEFAGIMERVGLICSSTGKPDGKKTGIGMSHYLLDGGMFERLTQNAPETLKSPFTLNNNFFIRENDSNEEKVKIQKQKIKYECSKCNAKVWGKPNLEIRCIPCNTNLY